MRPCEMRARAVDRDLTRDWASYADDGSVELVY
jgi:hypothetical protein